MELLARKLANIGGGGKKELKKNKAKEKIRESKGGSYAKDRKYAVHGGRFQFTLQKKKRERQSGGIQSQGRFYQQDRIQLKKRNSHSFNPEGPRKRRWENRSLEASHRRSVYSLVEARKKSG